MENFSTQVLSYVIIFKVNHLVYIHFFVVLGFIGLAVRIWIWMVTLYSIIVAKLKMGGYDSIL